MRSGGDGGFVTGEYFGFGAFGGSNIHAKVRLIRLNGVTVVVPVAGVGYQKKQP